MCKICPKCGGIAEFNAYYGRVTCTRCSWESEKNNQTTSLHTYDAMAEQWMPLLLEETNK